jgi:hypothetical protein
LEIGDMAGGKHALRQFWLLITCADGPGGYQTLRRAWFIRAKNGIEFFPRAGRLCTFIAINLTFIENHEH